MRIYAVINQALHHDSSYFDVTGVFATRSEAETFIESENLDFRRGIDRRDFGDDFDEIETDPEMLVRGFDTVYQSTKGYYEAWRIDEFDIPDNKVKHKWDFCYDEEVFDTAGANLAGVLTDGEHALYWHAYKDREDDAIEKCHIYNSIWMRESTEECVYDWTAENDSLVTEALNGCTDATRIAGENSVLHGIKFHSWRDDCLEPYQWKLLKAIQDKDIYEIKDGEVHILGYIYDTHDDISKPFRSVRCSGAYLPLEERADLAAKDSVLEMCKEYYAEITPQQAHVEFCGYANGTHHPVPLPMAQADKAEEGVVYIDIAPEDLPEVLPF